MKLAELPVDLGTRVELSPNKVENAEVGVRVEKDQHLFTTVLGLEGNTDHLHYRQTYLNHFSEEIDLSATLSGTIEMGTFEPPTLRIGGTYRLEEPDASVNVQLEGNSLQSAQLSFVVARNRNPRGSLLVGARIGLNEAAILFGVDTMHH